jgi:Diol dehydratase reactivase ATPase-like domain/DD-reactivating factor swiveling domain
VTFVAGIDVGNSTTEVVLARLRRSGIEVLGTARAPTRRAKGSARSLDGAVALVRRLEREHGVRIVRAVAARLRPVETGTASLPEPEAATGRLHVLAAGSRTASGNGFAIGRPFLLGRDQVVAGFDPARGSEPASTSGAVIGVVPRGMGYRSAVAELRRLVEAGVLVAVVMEDDEAVLVGNRLGGGMPVVDEIDAAPALRAELLAVEVTEKGSVLRALTDPLRLATGFDLAESERADAARLALRLQDCSNAVVALGSTDADGHQPERPCGWVEFEHGRDGFGHAHGRIVAGSVGLARGYALPPDEKPRLVDDLWTVDLSSVADAVLARTAGAGSRALGLAALRADAPLADPSAALSERLGVPVLVGSESRAGWTGGVSTPGAGPDSETVVIDVGGGTIDAVSSSDAVVAAGGGELLTVSVAALTGTTSAAAEWVKRGPANRVEAPQLLLGEDGGRGFLDRPAPAEVIGALVVQGPAGLLAFNRVMAPGEWRALRLRLKVEAIGGNVVRALRTLDAAAPRTVIVLGGPAGDDEVLATLARALPDGVAIGRGNVAGTLGHRYAVAYGLLSLLQLDDVD